LNSGARDEGVASPCQNHLRGFMEENVRVESGGGKEKKRVTTDGRRWTRILEAKRDANLHEWHEEPCGLKSKKMRKPLTEENEESEEEKVNR